MPRYIRPRRSGATIFFTVTLAQRGSHLLVAEVEWLRQAVRDTRAERPFDIEAWVVLPDHLHCIWRMSEGDADYATRWRLIKARFSRGVEAGERRASHVARGERAVWQRRFWGASHPRRGGFRGASAVLLVQSGEARAGDAGGGLAVFLGPPRDRQTTMGVGHRRSVGCVVSTHR